MRRYYSKKKIKDLLKIKVSKIKYYIDFNKKLKINEIIMMIIMIIIINYCQMMFWD